VLGVWKYRQIVVAADHRADPCVDLAHRSALLYSFATQLLAVFVELSAWTAWLNPTRVVQTAAAQVNGAREGVIVNLQQTHGYS
jgi:hypothetical protein